MWTLRFICITLLMTPLRRVTGLNLVSPFRRMMGLFAFFYGTLHFVTYVVLDRYAGLVDYPGGYFSAATMRNLVKSVADDVVKRPYITVGFIAFVLMVPLAITSTKGWIRRMGGKKWALLVAGQGRHHAAGNLRRDCRHPPRRAAVRPAEAGRYETYQRSSVGAPVGISTRSPICARMNIPPGLPSLSGRTETVIFSPGLTEFFDHPRRPR